MVDTTLSRTSHCRLTRRLASWLSSRLTRWLRTCSSWCIDLYIDIVVEITDGLLLLVWWCCAMLMLSCYHAIIESDRRRTGLPITPLDMEYDNSNIDKKYEKSIELWHIFTYSAAQTAGQKVVQLVGLRVSSRADLSVDRLAGYLAGRKVASKADSWVDQRASLWAGLRVDLSAGHSADLRVV